MQRYRARVEGHYGSYLDYGSARFCANTLTIPRRVRLLVSYRLAHRDFPGILPRYSAKPRAPVFYVSSTVPLDPCTVPLHRKPLGRERKASVLCTMYPCSPTTAPRTAGEMQNTQQTYGAVEVAAAAPKKKLSRKVVVVVAALGEG